MLDQIATIVLTAALSSAFTLAGARWALDRWADRLLSSKATALGGEIERRVRAGALQAGDELLPVMRDRMREGIESAIASAASKTVGETVQEITKSGARIVHELDALLGRKRD